MDYNKITIQYLKRFEKADFSADDYEAVVNEHQGKQVFFIVTNTSVTLNVEFGDGSKGSYLFLAGYNPVAVAKIFHDITNTVTNVQIAY